MATDTSKAQRLQPSALGQAHKQLGVIEDDMEYGERLVHYTHATQNDEVHVLEYRSLHRLNIFCLQNRLAKLKGRYLEKVNVSDAGSVELEQTLRRYSKCCQTPSSDFLFFSPFPFALSNKSSKDGPTADRAS